MATVRKSELEKQLIQIRKIAEHREVNADKAIRRTYKQLLKDLKEFVGYQYAELANDGKLTYEILAEKQYYARFLEEVQSKVDGILPEVHKEIKELVSEVYDKSYVGMVQAAKNTSPAKLKAAMQGLDFVLPTQIQQGVNNTLIEKILLSDVLEKNRKQVIYDLKRNINIGLQNGDRIDTVAKRISKVLDGDYQKAVTTARTETHRVREMGMQDGALTFDKQLAENQLGMRMVKIWRTMKDERVRPQVRRKSKKGWATKMSGNANHMVMDGKAVLATEKFELSDGSTTDVPGNSGVAAQDINCRCYVSYKLMSEKEYQDLTGKSFTD